MPSVDGFIHLLELSHWEKSSDIAGKTVRCMHFYETAHGVCLLQYVFLLLMTLPCYRLNKRSPRVATRCGGFNLIYYLAIKNPIGIILYFHIRSGAFRLPHRPEQPNRADDDKRPEQQIG